MFLLSIGEHIKIIKVVGKINALIMDYYKYYFKKMAGLHVRNPANRFYWFDAIYDFTKEVSTGTPFTNV